MVYGELGRCPLKLYVYNKMLSYWCRIVNSKENKFSHLMYKLMYELDKKAVCKFKWLDCVKNILDNSGLSYIWITQDPGRPSWLKKIVTNTLKDQFKQQWAGEIHESRKCINYRMFKNSLEIEPYLTMLDCNLRRQIARFRCRNTRLPVVIGSYNNVEYIQRVCKMCTRGEIGDEYHYLFNCTFFSQQRSQFLKSFYYKNPSSEKFENLFTVSENSMVKLAKFIMSITKECAT